MLVRGVFELDGLIGMVKSGLWDHVDGCSYHYARVGLGYGLGSGLFDLVHTFIILSPVQSLVRFILCNSSQ
jgi:hypothetical protein